MNGNCYDGQQLPYEGDFSYYFFYTIRFRFDNAVEAFNYACGEITEVQNPKKQDYSDYVWFD